MIRKRWAASGRLLLAGIITAGLALGTAGPVMAQASYVVQDLGVLPGDSSSIAWGINANGEVVGWSMGSNGTRAFLYTNAAGMVALPGLPDRPRSVARDINDAGVVVGSANAGGTDIGHAVMWSGGAVQDLGTLGTGVSSEAYGVNRLGQVVGWSDAGLGGAHGFLYSAATGMVDITPDSDTGYALDINDAGQVTGYKTAFGGYHAYRWQAGVFEDLGVLPGFAHSFGQAINASGRVAGNSGSASGDSERLIRSIAGGGLQNLGGEGQHNSGLGINLSGTVVGTKGNFQRALLYTDAGGLQDLNTLIDPSLGWLLMAATDINDAGQIVGRAFNNFTGQTHAVRLQPVNQTPAECTFHCLRSTSIVMQSQTGRKGSSSVTARVTVQDENATPMSLALVVATWTLPDGSHSDVNGWTDSNGVAIFTTPGGPGTYSLEIQNIVLSLYTFNPSESTLSASITITDKKGRPGGGGGTSDQVSR
jgi:probable HAF family extracellular repeat protein